MLEVGPCLTCTLFEKLDLFLSSSVMVSGCLLDRASSPHSMPDDGNGSSCQKPFCILNILELMDRVQHNIHIMNKPLPVSFR
jgi:hypothetical protein